MLIINYSYKVLLLKKIIGIYVIKKRMTELVRGILEKVL